MKNLKQFVEALIEGKGATFNINTGASPDTGFVVADGINEQVVDVTVNVGSLQKEVSVYIKSKAETLSKADSFLGGWIDGDKLYLDVVNVIEDVKQAVYVGLKRNELAIYDVEADRCVNLPSKRQKCGTETQRDTYLKVLAREVVESL